MYFLSSINENLSPAHQIKAMMMSIACKQSFQFSRFSDGELFMLLNKEIQLTPDGAWIDGRKVNSQKYPDHDCKYFNPLSDMAIVAELKSALIYSHPNYVKGLPLPCCVGREMFNEMLNLLHCNLSQWSTANLLINANYPFFISKILPILLLRPLIVVANKRASFCRMPSVFEHVSIDDNAKACINSYSLSLINILSELDAEQRSNLIILFAASYISNILIFRLSKLFPDVTMIDVGTAIHPLINLEVSRHYLDLYWSDPSSYSYHQCDMVL